MNKRTVPTFIWLCILAGVVLACIAAILLLRQTPADEALIFQDGALIHRLDLSAVIEPYSIIIESEAGTNVVALENGRIRIQEADCPDGSCVRQGWISGGMTPIVCLPHRLVIELESKAKPEVDAVAAVKS